MFSILSFTVFVFGMVLFLVSQDNTVVKFTAVCVTAFLIANGLCNALSMKTEEQKLLEHNKFEHEINTLWTRITEIDRNIFDEAERSSRVFNDEISAVWRDVETLREKTECCKRK
jgi:hypothetical protein